MPTLAEFLRHKQLVQASLPGKRRPIRPRRPGRPRPPMATELAYAHDLRQVAAGAREVLRQVLAPQIEALADEAGITTRRQDAYAQSLSRLMALVRATHKGILGDPQAEAMARKYASTLNEQSRRDTLRMISNSLSIDIFLSDPKVAADMQAFVQQNVKLIQSVPEKYFDQVEDSLLTGLRAGTRVEDLQADLEDRYDVPAARAELIARDQVGKFYGQLAQLRQEELGIEEYTWRTTGDERVRDWHQELDGQVFRWDEPPVTNNKGDRNHPGGDYQCRCTAEPVIKI